ncbi:MAG: hypothetical protein FWG17_05080 [Desulfovibrionaceae bacterium]|nr:hypothetical protein [Desulfovibrionaceae bacterium]
MAGTRSKCPIPCQHKDVIGGGQFCKFNKEFENGKSPCPLVKPSKMTAKAKLKEFWREMNEIK